MSYKLVIIFSILVKRSRRIFFAIAGVVTCNQCVGMLSLNSEIETCNHPFHSRKTKPKNIYSLPETGKGSRGISPGFAVAGVVTCNQCRGVLSLNSELETCNHLFHSRKTKPKNI